MAIKVIFKCVRCGHEWTSDRASDTKCTHSGCGYDAGSRNVKDIIQK